jgi:hypothetical protein
VAREDELDARLVELTQRLATEFADLGADRLRWAIARGLIHRAVHFATERPGVEFCALATYLGEMIAHAHKLAHGDKAHHDLH